MEIPSIAALKCLLQIVINHVLLICSGYATGPLVQLDLQSLGSSSSMSWKSLPLFCAGMELVP